MDGKMKLVDSLPIHTHIFPASPVPPLAPPSMTPVRERYSNGPQFVVYRSDRCSSPRVLPPAQVPGTPAEPPHAWVSYLQACQVGYLLAGAGCRAPEPLL